MNKAFKEKQYVFRLTLVSRRNAYKAAMNEKRITCKEVVESLYTMSCKDCNYGKSHCYCLAA
jgi:hypothetical protein